MKCNQKKEGAYSSQTPWQDNRPSRNSSFWGPGTRSQSSDLFSSRLRASLSLYAHTGLHTYTACIIETFTTLTVRHRACISFTKVYRDWLLQISNRSATNRTAHKIQSIRPGTLGIHTSSKTLDLLPQQDSSDASIPHSSWLKTYVLLIWKCEYLQELQMVR